MKYALYTMKDVVRYNISYNLLHEICLNITLFGIKSKYMYYVAYNLNVTLLKWNQTFYKTDQGNQPPKSFQYFLTAKPLIICTCTCKLSLQIIIMGVVFNISNLRQSFFPRVILLCLYKEPKPQQPRKPYTTDPTPHQLKTPTQKTQFITPPPNPQTTIKVQKGEKNIKNI